MRRSRQTDRLRQTVASAVKIVLFACILTAVLVLLLAITMKWEWIGMESVDAVNTCIKALCACFVGFLAEKLQANRKWLLSGFLGVLYMLLSFVIFSILNGSFHVSLGNASDMLMAFACASCTSIACGILRERLQQKAGAAR